MSMFVHFAPESRVALIRRNGISRLRKASGGHPGGIFAMPVMRNFYISHQWLRELKRRGQAQLRASTSASPTMNRSGSATMVRPIGG